MQAEPTIADALDRRIAKDHYVKSDLPDYVSKLKYLDSDEQSLLLKSLMRFESLFEGTLGEWKGKPYCITLRNEAVGMCSYYGNTVGKYVSKL